MGVIKNDVGRPSNKTIMTRNILKLIGLIILIGLVIGVCYFINNNEKTVEIKKSYNKEDAKRLVDKYYVHLYSLMTEEIEEEDYKIYLSILNAKPVSINSTCKEMYGEDAKFNTDGEFYSIMSENGTPAICHDGGQNIYDYSLVEKEYKYLFGKDATLPKKIITGSQDGGFYGYSKPKDAYVELSCNCGGRSPADIAYVYDAYTKGKKLYVTFGYFEYDGFDMAPEKVEILVEGITSDLTFDDNYNIVGDVDKVFENNKYALPTYEMVFEEEDDHYIYKTITKLEK